MEIIYICPYCKQESEVELDEDDVLNESLLECTNCGKVSVIMIKKID